MKITTKLQNIFMFTKVAALIIVIILGIVALCQGKLHGKV
jgi:L-asparagine transporter-like permease